MLGISLKILQAECLLEHPEAVVLFPFLPQLKFTAYFTAMLTFLHIVNHLQAAECSK
jgi:hypothetical protein